jgi:hypothetical protein
MRPDKVLAQGTAFLDEDFLAVADRPAIVQAIAVTADDADACDLQRYDPGSASLQSEALHATTSRPFFAAVGRTQPTACTTALNTREAVLVDDVGRSPIFGTVSSWDRCAPSVRGPCAPIRC